MSHDVFFSRQLVLSLIWIVSEGQTIFPNIQFKPCIMSQFFIKLLQIFLQMPIFIQCTFIYMKLWNFECKREKNSVWETHIYCIRKAKLHQSYEWMEFYHNCVERQSWKHSATRVTVSECVCAGGLIYRRKPHHTACI